MRDIARALKDAHGDRARQISTRQLPDWATRLLALFDTGAAGAVSKLGFAPRIDTSRTRAALGIEFIPARDAAAATAASLFEHAMA